MIEANVDPDLVLPKEYQNFPLKALRPTARNKISQYLNLEGTVVVCLDDDGREIDVSTNYNGLAELAGFDYLEIRNLALQKNPTIELLDSWTNKESYNATVGYMWRYLQQMEREDILKDCRRVILNDCKVYKEFQQNQLAAERLELQVPIVGSSGDSQDNKIDELAIATKQDVENALENIEDRVKYDAFVCYSIEDYGDRQFIREMIEEMEYKRGLKLFVPGRDDIPGAAQNTINAYLIEKRCRRVVILLSRAFLQSPVCDFQLKFAQCLAPGARSKRLIPVMRDKNIPIPRILRFLAICDFTKSDMVDWVWERLGLAIQAPIGPMISDSSIELEESLKEVTFPPQRRRLQNESEGAASASGSGRIRRDSVPLSSSATCTSKTQAAKQAEFSTRRVASYAGRSSSESSFEIVTNDSAPPSVFSSGASGARPTPPIPIDGKGPCYPRATYSPQQNELKMVLTPQEDNEMCISTEEQRHEHFV